MEDPLNVQRIGGLEVTPRAGQVEPTQLRTARAVTPAAPGGTSFANILTETIGEVQRLQNEADTTIRKLVSGEIKDVTETMVAVERADLAFQTMMVVRSKIVAAYDEIMRMQV
jgi:flagellar hook-basal body complex protein FliE